MKLSLPHKSQAALMAAIASVSFTTLSSGTIAAVGAALLTGQRAQASTATELNAALAELRTLNQYMAGEDYTFSFTLTTVVGSGTGSVLTLASGTDNYYFVTQGGMYGGLSTASGSVSDWPVPDAHLTDGLNVWTRTDSRLTGWISRDANGTGQSAKTLNGSTITVTYSASTDTTTFELYHKEKDTTDRVVMTGVALAASNFSFGEKTSSGTDLVFRIGKDYVWNGTNGNSTWNTTTANTNWLDGAEQAAWTVAGNALFTATAAVKTVTIGENVTARNMVVQDNYTFTMGGNTVNVTAGMTVASGKTLTLDGEGTLTAGLITGGGNVDIAGGSTLETRSALSIGGTLSGAGAIDYTGTNASTFSLTGNIGGYNGTLDNQSDADLTLNLGTSAKDVNMNITHTGSGKVNLVLGAEDYVLSGTQEINNSTQGTNKTTLVGATGDVTATGKVVTGRLVVGEASSSTGAVFTLSGANAMLNMGGDARVYDGAVQGYGTFKLVDGATQELTNISGYNGKFNVDATSSLTVTTNTLPGTLTVTNDSAGELHMRSGQGSGSQNVNLKTVSSPNLHLDRDDNHNSRFVYNGDSNISGVDHLYFDGAQLWLNGKNMTGDNAFTGDVTFNATTYSESDQPVLNGAAMRINNSAAFNGSVEVNAYTKLAFATNGTDIAFGDTVTGSGQLDLKSWDNHTGSLTIGGDASGYQGFLTSDAGITLNVASGGQLSLAGGSSLAGAVTLEGSLTMNGETASTISGAISGSGTLTKDGAGTLTLSGDNTYTGATVLNEGMTVFDVAANKTETLNGALSGSGAITKAGAGVLVLGGGNTNYTGNVVVDAGTLKLNSDNALGANNATTERTITINQGGTIDLNSKDNGQYAYILNGGSLVNNGNGTNESHAQTTKLTLNADSTIGGSGTFRLLGSSYGTTAITLDDFVLTKSGNNSVVLYNTDVTADTGSLLVTGGNIEFTTTKPDGTVPKSRVSADITLDGGTISGLYKYADSDSAVTRNLTANQTVTASAAIELGNNVTLATNVAANQILTISGDLTGSGNLTKDGTGTLALSGNNTYTGGTTISAGKLVAGSANALGTGPVVVNADGTLELTSAVSSISGNVNVGQGGTLKLAGANHLAIGDTLTLASGSILDLANITGATGTESITLATTTNGISGDLTGVTLSNWTAPTGYTSTLKTQGNNLVLTFAQEYDGLIWDNASTSGKWNTTDLNWHTEAAPGSHTAFTEGDDVRFTAAPSNPAPTLEGNVSAGTMTIDSGVALTVNGGSNTLAVDSIQGAGASLTLNGGTVTVAQNSTVGSLSGNSSLAIGENATLTVGGTADSTYSGAISGSGAITKNGAGTLEVTNISNYSGTFTVNDGKLLVTTNNLPGTLTVTDNSAGELHLMGGAAQGAASVNTDLTTISSPNLYLDRDSNHNSRFNFINDSNLAAVEHLYFDGGQLWVQNTMAYSGDVTFNATTYTEINQDILAGAAMRINSAATFSGAVDVEAYTKLAFAASNMNVTFGGTVTGNSQLDLKSFNGGNGTFTISDDASGYQGYLTSDSNITLNVASGGQLSLAGGSNLNGAVTLEGSLTMNGDTDSIISGAISGNGTLTKTDAGTLTLSGNNTYTGGTTISAGTLVADSANALGTGTVTLGSGTLDITSSVSAGALTMTGGTLTMHNTEALTTTGAITLSSGTLDLTGLDLSSGAESYTLATATNGTVSASNVSFTLGTGYDPSLYSLDVLDGNKLVLTFTQPDLGLIWDGTQSAAWTTDGAVLNWHNAGEDPGTAAFITGSSVTFESAANPKNTTVLQEDITAGDMIVQSGANVTVTTNDHNLTAALNVAQDASVTFKTNGSQDDVDTISGTISGAGDIHKDGDGTLVLNAATNTNTGTLVIDDGTVLVANVGALGSQGSRNVMVTTNGTLAFDPNGASSAQPYTVDTLTLDRGGVLTFSGTEALNIGTLNIQAASSLDLANILLDSYDKDYILATVQNFNAIGSGILVGGSDAVQFVSMMNLTAAEGFTIAPEAVGSLHYNTNTQQLTLRLDSPHAGFYWQPDRENSVWDISTENWLDNGGNPATFVNQPGGDSKAANSVYFLNAGDGGREDIVIDIDGKQVYVRDMIVADGDYYFTASEGKEYDIKQDQNRISNFVVRSGASAHFEGAVVSGGQFDVIHICKSAEAISSGIHLLDVFSLNNEGNYTANLINDPAGTTAFVGHADNTGNLTVIVPDMEGYVYLMLGEVLNHEGATMHLSGPQIMTDYVGRYGDGTIHNEGSLQLDATGYNVTGMVNVMLPVQGIGSMETIGPDATVTLLFTVDQNSMNLGAHLTDFYDVVTIKDTTELTAANITAEDGRATARFNASSDLGEHVVMGTNTTLDLNTGSQANPVYTLGEVTSTTAEAQGQELIVRSGATANVEGEVSLANGKAQIAGGGKLTIGGATSNVGELAATGGGTAVVELNGTTAGSSDPVLNATKLSNANGTTLQVVNTDADSDKTAQVNIGDADAATPTSSYKGTLQYGVGAGAASGSGMNLTIKDDNVAAGAVLEAYYDAAAPANGSVNIIVDTENAKVLGLSDNINDPEANRAMKVYGTGEHTAEDAQNNSLEITGDGEYTYAGKLGANLDIAYTGTGSQTIEGGVDGFNGSITVDNGSSAAGVLEILNASSVSITDLTIGANDTLDLNDGTNVGTAVVSGTMKAGGTSDAPSKLDGSLTLGSSSTYDVSASGGTGGLQLTGALTINSGAQLSSGDLLGVSGLGWFGMYDLAWDVDDMSSFGSVDWSEGVDATEVFANTGLRENEYYVRYSQGDMGGNGNNVGAVYIYRIPEPTTGTLSLLALCALAARRRRK